jgi:co-chaperonin GroES (HSP10)
MNKKTSQWDKSAPKEVAEVGLLPEEEITSPTQLPAPKGYKILCAIPKIEDTYQGGIIKSDKVKQVEENSTVVLYVLKMGDMAYKDETKFPTGAWCQVNDFILTRAYTGTRIKIHGVEFRIINDDSVEAVVDDPRGYQRC